MGRHPLIDTEPDDDLDIGDPPVCRDDTIQLLQPIAPGDDPRMFLDVSRDQYALTWSLLQLYLDPLTDDDCFWQPATPCWSVHEVNGRYLPDWADVEPDPVPVATIGWLTWHMCWWWQSAQDALAGRTPPEPTQTPWAGSAAATRAQLADLHTRWLTLLDSLTEDRLRAIAPYPWTDVPTRSVAHTIAWVNGELMKNTAEIGELQRLRALRG